MDRSLKNSVYLSYHLLLLLFILPLTKVYLYLIIFFLSLQYQSAGMIETEACFKAAQIAIQQGCPLQAASFLKNVVLINLTLTEQEKVIVQQTREEAKINLFW